MIINFSIENFGPIKDKQTLSFEADKSTHLESSYVVEIAGLRLLKIALIFGANASGKTTILKALDFLRDLVLSPLSTKHKNLDFEPFLFDINSTQAPSKLSLEFLVKGIKYLYEVKFNKQAILEEALYHFSNRKTNIFKRTTDVEKQFAAIKFGSTIKINKTELKILESNTLWNNTVFGGFEKTNIILEDIKMVRDWFAEYIYPIIQPKTNLDIFVTRQIEEQKIAKDLVLQIIQKADFNISDIIIEKDETDMPKDVFDALKNKLLKDAQEDKKEEVVSALAQLKKIVSLEQKFKHTVGDKDFVLPFEQESLGTKRYYGLAGVLALLVSKSTCFNIDELEDSLHPDLYKHFLISFLKNSSNSQLIATTHYRELLEDKDLFRNDAIWFTDKSETPWTELYALADFDTSVVRDTTNILNAYKAGKLNAKPNLGDNYIDL